MGRALQASRTVLEFFDSNNMTSQRTKVFLTGAAGKTGRLVLEKLRQHPEFEVIGLVRRPEQAAELGPGVLCGDISKPETYQEALGQCDKLVILTSAVPKMHPTANPSDPPSFYFEPGEMPEQVDWEGQRHQIDLAKAAGLQQVVQISSMGVTRADHPLNRVGGGNILMWKRMAEEYLVNSGLPYTIIHPGGLIDQPGGRRELVVGKGDSLIDTPHRTLPRADLAEVVVQALLLPEALNTSFDLVSLPEGEGDATWEWEALFDQATPGLCGWPGTALS